MCRTLEGGQKVVKTLHPDDFHSITSAVLGLLRPLTATGWFQLIAYGFGSGTSLGGWSLMEYPVFGHFTEGFVGLYIPAGLVLKSQTCKS